MCVRNDVGICVYKHSKVCNNVEMVAHRKEKKNDVFHFCCVEWKYSSRLVYGIVNKQIPKENSLGAKKIWNSNA